MSSQVAAGPPMEALPSLPIPLVPALQPLLPQRVQLLLLPYYTRNRQENPVVPLAAPDSIPPWTVWLERWYQIYHPATWVYLDRDEDADVDVTVEVVTQYLQERMVGQEKGARASALRKLLGELSRGFWVRFTCIYGLHAVRSVFLERSKKRYLANWSALEALPSSRDLEQQILRDLPDGGTENLPTFEQGSVWPLVIPPPACSSPDDPPAPKHILALPPSPGTPADLVGPPPAEDRARFALPEPNQQKDAGVALGQEGGLLARMGGLANERMNGGSTSALQPHWDTEQITRRLPRLRK
ncbi:hypothetical protein JCM11251_004435 [Rhodosporidiobolus azoricus]